MPLPSLPVGTHTVGVSCDVRISYRCTVKVVHLWLGLSRMTHTHTVAQTLADSIQVELLERKVTGK